jgi:hypothetical protein
MRTERTAPESRANGWAAADRHGDRPAVRGDQPWPPRPAWSRGSRLSPQPTCWSSLWSARSSAEWSSHSPSGRAKGGRRWARDPHTQRVRRGETAMTRPQRDPVPGTVRSPCTAAWLSSPGGSRAVGLGHPWGDADRFADLTFRLRERRTRTAETLQIRLRRPEPAANATCSQATSHWEAAFHGLCNLRLRRGNRAGCGPHCAGSGSEASVGYPNKGRRGVVSFLGSPSARPEIAPVR